MNFTDYFVKDNYFIYFWLCGFGFSVSYYVKKNIYTKEELENVIKDCYSIAEVLRRLGRRPVGGNYKILKLALKEFNLDISHFTGQSWNYGARRKGGAKLTKLEEVLKEDSRYSTHMLRLRLIKEGLKQYECENCLQDKWLDNPIPLQLHHINGVNTDNRLENINLLCPNCHALTPNFASKNKKKNSLAELRESEWREFRDSKNSETKNITNDIPEVIKIVKPKRNLIKIEKFCKTCNKSFNENKIYCSVACYNEDKCSKIPKVPEIIEAFKKCKSFLGVSNHFNVSDTSVKKWVDNYGIMNMIEEFLSYKPKIE